MDLPDIVIEEIAICFDALSWQSIFAYNTIITSKKSVRLRNESREWTANILNMSHVHRTWTIAAQRALRRHVKLHSYANLEAFSEQGLAGPHIHGLSYVYTPQSGLDEDEVVPETHWELLSEVISQSPNIRQLSVKSIYQFLSRGPEYKYWCRDRYARYVSCVFASLKQLSRLDALVFDTDFRVTRYFSFFSEFCAILSELHNLQYLQTIIWRDKSCATPTFLDRSPPPKLKKIALHVVSPLINAQCLEWLLKSRGEYCLGDLIFSRCDIEFEGNDVLLQRLHSIEAFPTAPHVRFVFEDENSFWYSSRFIQNLATPIVNLFSSLRSLELPISTREQLHSTLKPATRSTIENLTIRVGDHSFVAYGQPDKQLSRWISEGAFPRLRDLQVRQAYELKSYGEYLRSYFPLLIGACASAGITLTIGPEIDASQDLDRPAYWPLSSL